MSASFLLRAFFLRMGWLVAALAACGSPRSGGQTGEEGAGCLPIRRESIALDAPSSLGFSGADVLAMLGAEQNRTLSYEGGGTTALQLGIDHDGGSVEFVEREFRRDDSGREPAISDMELAPACDDVLELELTLTFETADGAFDEAWAVRLDADTAGTARVFHVFDPEMISGSYRIDRGSYEDVSANISLNLVGMNWTGSLSGQGEERGASENPDAVVSSTEIPIATF
jgi:hypothetical protein